MFSTDKNKLPYFILIITYIKCDFIFQIEKATSQEEYDKVAVDCSDFFEQASFHKKLAPETAACAVVVIKENYMFYRCLGSIRQFMEGD